MILVEVAEQGLVVEHGLHEVIGGCGALHTPPYVGGRGRGLSIRSAGMHAPIACLQLLNLLLNY